MYEFLWMSVLLVIAFFVGAGIIFVQKRLSKQLKMFFIGLLIIFLFGFTIIWDAMFGILFIILDAVGIVYLFFKLDRIYQYLIGGLITLPIFLLGLLSCFDEAYYDYVIVWFGIEFRPDHFITIFFFIVTTILLYLGIKGLKDKKECN
jgi:hypothetical protein